MERTYVLNAMVTAALAIAFIAAGAALLLDYVEAHTGPIHYCSWCHWLWTQAPVQTDTLYLNSPVPGVPFVTHPKNTSSYNSTIELINLASEPVNATLISDSPCCWRATVSIPANSGTLVELPHPALYWLGAVDSNYVSSHYYLAPPAPTVPNPDDRPRPDKPPAPSPIETLYHRTSQVRIPTSLVTLVSAANLTVGVPAHALAASEYVAFAAPSGGPSYHVGLWQGNVSIANFSLPAGTNHALALPGEGFYEWTAQAPNHTAAEGMVSYFG